jgi:hypothetical protein
MTSLDEVGRKLVPRQGSEIGCLELLDNRRYVTTLTPGSKPRCRSISGWSIVASHYSIMAACGDIDLMQASRWLATGVSLIAIEVFKMQHDPFGIIEIAGEPVQCFRRAAQ